MAIITQKIILQNVPSQTLNIVLNNQDCTIEILLLGEHYYFSLELNNEKIVSNVKINFGCILLNYQFLKTKFNGNFIFINEDDNTLINYNNFGNITNLYYVYEE